MAFSYLGAQAISRADFGFFVTAMSMRDRTMGMTSREDGLFLNLSIFDDLCMQHPPSTAKIASWKAFSEQTPVRTHRTQINDNCPSNNQPITHTPLSAKPDYLRWGPHALHVLYMCFTCFTWPTRMNTFALHGQAQYHTRYMYLIHCTFALPPVAR